jgi:capsular polysaccharide transport system permease protein
LQRGDLPNPPPPRGFAAAAVSVAPFEAQTDLFDHVFQIRALILRELRLHHRGTRLGFLLEYVRPALVMTLHYVIFTAINKYMPAKIPVELFIIGSFTTWYACAHVIRATMGGKKHTADIQGVTEIHLAIAKTVWEFFSMFSFCIFCVAVLALIGWPEPVPEIPATVVNFALAVCLGLGIGLILQALGRVFPSMDMLKKPVLWILFITSGHYFSISGGRHGLWMYMWFNPCLHLAELQRHAFDPGYPTQLVTVWYPAVTAAGLIITGLMLNKWTRQRGLD